MRGNSISSLTLHFSRFVGFTFWVLIVLVGSPSVFGGDPTDSLEKFLAEFEEAFPAASEPDSLEAYATPERYDRLFLGESFENSLKDVSNEKGGIAWGLSYQMNSLNEMTRATGDPKYLEANRRMIEAVISARDDRLGKALFTGVVAPIWGCDLYAKRGRAAFAVHTGVIVTPMLDFLLLAKESPPFGATLAAIQGDVLRAATEAIAFHDRQWREGPEAGAGHYIAMDQEDDIEGKPLPGNRLAAMGLANWGVWKLTGSPTHKDRAEKIAGYIKHRLTLGTDGAYYWPYWLPLEPVKGEGQRTDVDGEDSSHGGLTASFPIRMAFEGAVFDRQDLERFAKTFTLGLGRLGSEGIMLPRVNGEAGLSPTYVWGVARWLCLSPFDPEVAPRIEGFYLSRVKNPNALELSHLIRHRLTRESK